MMFNILYALLILALVTGCQDSEIGPPPQTLDEAKERWGSVQTGNYQVDVERYCFCPPPRKYTIVVSNQVIFKVIDRENDKPVGSDAGYRTVDELFTWLEEIASRDPQKLELRFHPDLGYPTYINYNQSDMIADEEIEMELENLRFD